jgi:NAD(P)-dependent dehydrogenase (short-subunit alcohol dehydrogenase family)
MADRNTVFITGASSGIGKAAAQFFLAQNWAVAGAARTKEGLDYLRGSPHSEGLVLDVTREETIARAIESSHLLKGKISCIVNCAGSGLSGPLEGVGTNGFRSIFETNLFGPISIIRAFLPKLRAQQDGTIINVSSVVGRVAVPFMSPYVSSKFALEGLSESIRFELEPLGIRVKVVEPGGVASAFRQEFRLHEAYASGLRAVQETLRLAEAPGKLASPESVARVIFRAATDRTARLRFPVATQGALALRSLLPDFVWNRLLRRNFGLT